MYESEDLHKVALEEFLQLPLGCRVGKVTDVETATFGGTGKDGVIVGGVLVVGGLASEGGIGQSVGNVIHGVGSSVSDFLDDGRHDEKSLVSCVLER